MGIPRNSQEFLTMQISIDLMSLEFLGISVNGKTGLFIGLEFLGIEKTWSTTNTRTIECIVRCNCFASLSIQSNSDERPPAYKPDVSR